MLLIDKIGKVPVVLGSQSPRRKELLSSLDLQFDVIVREVDESVPSNIAAADAAEYIALKKIKAFDESSFFDKIVITADTVVVDNAGQVLGKPKSKEEARAVLESLSGWEHLVYTGVVIGYQGEVRSFTDDTSVLFRMLREEEINYYLEKYAPYDKAGSYGIQEWIGRIGVRSIQGSFENVMGLPTCRLYEALQDMLG